MDEFVPLREILRQAQPTTENVDSSAVRQPELDVEAAIELLDVLGEARRFRAALADALDVAVERLLRDIASDVVARELQLGAADVDAIVRAALRRHEREWPLRVRAHPDDMGALGDVDCAVAADAALRRGDLAFDLKSGTIDLSLGVRLETALRALVP
jgi:hypothetical protein